VVKLQTHVISDSEYTKLQNQFENNYIGANSTALGVAESLASGYTFFHNTNNVNLELAEIRKVTKQDIQNVAKKYLNPNQRVVLYYLPKK
jgi:zinc protease